MTQSIKDARLVEFVRQHGHAAWVTEDGRIAIESLEVNSEGVEYMHVTYSLPNWEDVRLALGY